MTEAKYFLGVDCATKRIDAVIIDRKKNWKTSISIATDETDIDLRLTDLYEKFAKATNETILQAEPQWILAGIENPIYVQNVKVTVSITQTVACAKIIMHLAGIKFFGIDNRAWKKAVLGDGNSDKNKIRAFAEVLWGTNIKSQDLADAACIALWCHQRGG